MGTYHSRHPKNVSLPGRMRKGTQGTRRHAPRGLPDERRKQVGRVNAWERGRGVSRCSVPVSKQWARATVSPSRRISFENRVASLHEISCHLHENLNEVCGSSFGKLFAVLVASDGTCWLQSRTPLMTVTRRRPDALRRVLRVRASFVRAPRAAHVFVDSFSSLPV